MSHTEPTLLDDCSREGVTDAHDAAPTEADVPAFCAANPKRLNLLKVFK